MGIYDRDYYRKEGPSYLDQLSVSGTACKWLLIINIAAYILQIVSPAVTDWLILDTRRVMQGEVWRVITYAFLHDLPPNWMHIFFNMLFLWWFGSDVEALYGTREFLFFYMICAFLGGCAFQGWQVLMMDRPALCLGASGAVTGVMVLFACHYPSRMILVFLILPVPVWLFVLFQVVRDAAGLMEQTMHPIHRIDHQVAVSVHLAGAAFGFIYYKSKWHISDWLPSWPLSRSQRRPRLRVVRADGEVAEPVPVGAAQQSPIDEQLEAKVDAVLEKVARKGQDSLTDSERAILLQASEIYKRRRT